MSAEERAMRELAAEWGVDPDDAEVREHLKSTAAYAAKCFTIAFRDLFDETTKPLIRLLRWWSRRARG